MKSRNILLLSSVVGTIFILVPLFALFTTGHKFFNTSGVYYFLEHPIFGNLGASAYQTRNSLMKVSNIIHFPSWFRESKIEEFQLTINPDDLALIEGALPKNKFSGYLESENKIFAGAFFKSNNYAGEVEVRYRGAHPEHWNSAKRSLLIKFPKDNLFRGMKSIDLIIPEDREYFIEALNIERAKRAGLTARRVFFSRLNINNRDAGVYFVQERFSREWLELNGIPETSEVFSQSIGGWRNDIHEENKHYDAVKTLLSSPEAMLELMDLDKWYKAMAISILANSPHGLDSNLNLLFNSATGKLEPLLEDIGLNSSEAILAEDLYNEFFTTMISPNIISSPKLYREYIEILKDMSGDKNLEKDLAFYDNLVETLKPEFYKDQTKRHGDLFFSSYTREAREKIIENYEQAQEFAELSQGAIGGTTLSAAAEEKQIRPQLAGSFKYLPDVSRRVSGDIVWSGTYSFRENVIIPKNTKLIINPGTKIYLAEGVSIISYSPIRALGTKNNPILFARINPAKNWGSVGVINSAEKSEFHHVTMIGGSSSEEINGVIFTGMLAAHNSDLYVDNSNFYQDGDDDAINVKYATGEIINSKFFDMNQDAIDLDFTENFSVMGNVFSNIGKGDGGDAIDLSFGNNAVIAQNKINTCSDKGVSVGEKSRPEIYENTIKNCLMGIAVKDESYAIIHDNIFSGNEQDISLYIKKQIFGAPEAEIYDNVYDN